MSELIQVPPGLKGVAVVDTEVGDVRGQEGFFHYRQYSAVELAERRSLEDAWFLLFSGHLPDAAERVAFATELAAAGPLSGAVVDVLPTLSATAGGESLGAVAAAIGVLAADEDMQPVVDLDPVARRADAVRLCGVVPVIVANLHRLRHGLAPVAPGDGPMARRYLRMVTGAEPADDAVDALERYLTLTTDHGMNASTFTARVITSAGASVAAAVTGALGALSGPLHGGAPSRALAALDEIGEPSRTADWVAAKLAAGEKLMGFGHAVYQSTDPRSLFLKDLARKLGGPRVEQAIEVEERIQEALEAQRGRGLVTNVEFYAGVVMERCGLPRSMFTPTFAVSRMGGWCANILEQAASGKILRPGARYVGPAAPQPVP